jgi:hypothetical protein
LRNSIRKQEGGIFQNFVGDEMLEVREPAGGLVRSNSFWLAVIGLPPLFFLLVAWGTRHWRLARRDPKAARAERAYTRFRSGTRHLGAGDAAAVSKLQTELQRYFGDRFGLAPQAVEGHDVSRLLEGRGVDAKVQGKIIEYWERSDARRYSPQGSNGHDLKQICSAMPALIAQVERGLKP